MTESWVWKGVTALLGLILLVIVGRMVYSRIEKANRSDPQYGLLFENPPVQEGNPGREGGGLEDTVIILESTNYNDTMKWLQAIKDSRKSEKDLPVHLYQGTSVFLSEYRRVRAEVKKYWNTGVSATMQNRSSIIDSVLKKTDIQFVIELTDTNEMGEDFADLYYLGKEVIKRDWRINCVCGGDKYHENHPTKLLKPSQGNVLWLSDQDCDMGQMLPREYYSDVLSGEPISIEDLICIRPEVSRISNDALHVTRIPWNLDKYDPRLLTVKEFKRRMLHDFCNSKLLEGIEWNNLKTMPDDQVYVFPYEEQTDLDRYFDKDDDEEKLEMHFILQNKRFGTTFLLHYYGRKVYIVERDVFEGRRRIGYDDYFKKVPKAEEKEESEENEPTTEKSIEKTKEDVSLDEEIQENDEESQLLLGPITWTNSSIS